MVVLLKIEGNCSCLRAKVAHMVGHLPTTQCGKWVAFRQGLLSNLLNPKAGAIFAMVLPQFLSPGDLPLRLVLMIWLNLYGYLVSQAGQSRFGTRVRAMLQGVTGVVLLALGVRLAFEQK
jgi:threonine/homoserine/homoserine lactone efflux protein